MDTQSEDEVSSAASSAGSSGGLSGGILDTFAFYEVDFPEKKADTIIEHMKSRGTDDMHFTELAEMYPSYRRFKTELFCTKDFLIMREMLAEYKLNYDLETDGNSVVMNCEPLEKSSNLRRLFQQDVQQKDGDIWIQFPKSGDYMFELRDPAKDLEIVAHFILRYHIWIYTDLHGIRGFKGDKFVEFKTLTLG